VIVIVAVFPPLVFVSETVNVEVSSLGIELPNEEGDEIEKEELLEIWTLVRVIASLPVFKIVNVVIVPLDCIWKGLPTAPSPSMTGMHLTEMDTVDAVGVALTWLDAADSEPFSTAVTT
jgi:hypothetical protein